MYYDIQHQCYTYHQISSPSPYRLWCSHRQTDSPPHARFTLYSTNRTDSGSPASMSPPFVPLCFFLFLWPPVPTYLILSRYYLSTTSFKLHTFELVRFINMPLYHTPELAIYKFFAPSLLCNPPNSQLGLFRHRPRDRSSFLYDMLLVWASSGSIFM
jgi:hypothetical protein